MLYLITIVDNDKNVRCELYDNKEKAEETYKMLLKKYEYSEYEIFMEKKDKLNVDLLKELNEEESEDRKYDRAYARARAEKEKEFEEYMEDMNNKLKSLNITKEDLEVYRMNNSSSYVLLMRKKGEIDYYQLSRKEIIERYRSSENMLEDSKNSH